jgi:hypothetical protein
MENKFYVKPFGGSEHDPEEKITFLTPVPKIISKSDAVNLCANIVVLLSSEDRNRIGKLVSGEEKEPSSTEFPKMLYDHKRNKEITVANAAEEKSARAAGATEKPLAKYDHGAAQRAEEAASSVPDATGDAAAAPVSRA